MIRWIGCGPVRPFDPLSPMNERAVRGGIRSLEKRRRDGAKTDIPATAGDISNRPVSAVRAKALGFETRKLASHPGGYFVEGLTGAEANFATMALDRSQ